MLLSCGPTKVAVVTKEGRFDLNTTEFVCCVCKASRIASNEDYLCSGYWPSSLSNNSYFTEEDLLGMWYHLRHKTPGTSERKFIETLQEISLENNRDKEILRHHGNCKLCGRHPHSMQADAIRKLYRFASAKDRHGESLYKDPIMANDKTQLEHISKIEKKIPADKGDDVCGSSAWKAARGDSYSKRNINITGLEMMSCTHGTVVYSANLFKGETYKHTYLQHLKAYEKGSKFFCNDIICKYWPFAVKVGNLFADSNPEYKKLTQDMVPFLSRSHGLGHFWACRARCKTLLYGKKLQSMLDHRGLNKEDLPLILQRFKKQVKLVNTRNATFFDTCKARTANRKIMSKKKKRVDTIVELLSGKGIKVSKENLNTGFFPWHDTTKLSLGDDYELIDTWMLSLRYEEAIVQSKKEMSEFIRSLTSLCFDLQNDIRNYEKIMPVTLLNYSRSIMATTEIARIRELMEKGVNQFTDALNLNISED
ncbi:hypothetical protein OUZ56_005476 [Daphnia magna]|uniref:CxC3 like cysteine cluster domain-containing protein n=1 Tax=Daphnia magna TaxID=35525 RepID=A0ABQ9YSZ3_9CRUS|nr:hypothetical protein OUZ56_005476 [Daphnia magna]